MKNMENISFERSGLLVRRKFREYLVPTILTTISMSLAAMVDGVLVGNILGDREFVRRTRGKSDSTSASSQYPRPLWKYPIADIQSYFLLARPPPPPMKTST